MKHVIEEQPPLEQLIEQGIRSRPELMALDAQIRAEEEFVARSKSNMRPRFTIY